MKEELQGKLVEILTSIQTAAGKASDFALAELPDIAQSYIVYGRVTLTFTAVLCALLIPLCVWCTIRFSYHERMYWKASGEAESFHAARKGTFLLGAFVGGGLLVVLAAVSFPGVFLVWFAPKVWLLKEIAGLLK